MLTSTSTVATEAAPAPRKAKAYYICDKGNYYRLHSYMYVYVLIYYYSEPLVIQPLFISTLRMESEEVFKQVMSDYWACDPLFVNAVIWHGCSAHMCILVHMLIYVYRTSHMCMGNRIRIWYNIMSNMCMGVPYEYTYIVMHTCTPGINFCMQNWLTWLLTKY